MSFVQTSALAPKHFKEILGKTASKDLKRGDPLLWDMVKS
ncbi:MAG: SAF domain-containing protein [Bdellovibrionota bacterium]